MTRMALVGSFLQAFDSCKEPNSGWKKPKTCSSKGLSLTEVKNLFLSFFETGDKIYNFLVSNSHMRMTNRFF
jgi:hypothetical protein